MSTTKGEFYYPEEFADAELLKQTYLTKTLIDSQVTATDETDEHCASYIVQELQANCIEPKTQYARVYE